MHDPLSKKARHTRRAFFIALYLLLALANPPTVFADDCKLIGEAQTVSVRKVLDGDTVVLKDGRHVRLIGINAPEVAHETSKNKRGNAAEPWSMQAKDALARRVLNQPVKLQLGELAVDHYGRALGRLFDGAGNSVQAALLREGLGFAVVKAPDFRYVSCVGAAQQYARERKLGVWGDNYYRPHDARRIQRSDTGFRRIRGLVERVEVRRKQVWIDLRGEVAIRIAAKNARRFDAAWLRSLSNREIEVSGWLVPRKTSSRKQKKPLKPYVVEIDDPVLLKLAR